MTWGDFAQSIGDLGEKSPKEQIGVWAALEKGQGAWRQGALSALRRDSWNDFLFLGRGSQGKGPLHEALD